MCPKQVHEGRDDAIHVPKAVCVVMIDLGNLRDQIFPRTEFAASALVIYSPGHPRFQRLQLSHTRKLERY